MSDLIERLEARADIEEHGAAISSDEPISALLREAIAALRAQLGVAEDELASLRAQIAQPADMEKAVAAGAEFDLIALESARKIMALPGVQNGIHDVLTQAKIQCEIIEACKTAAAPFLRGVAK